MRKLILLFGITFSIIHFSCKKLASDGPGEIYGKWKLTETLMDPGDGSGKYKKVKENLFLTFDKSGNVNGDAAPELQKFKILDSVSIEFTSKNYSIPLTYRYKVTERTLTLNPPCIEGCGLKFIRQ
ncbi:hypothetical protein [Pedobacter aquatilis]|uniref:hypothetical protein n=1 Tax=Pedobacter aquatilis TaxID=351343 RepID=UPI00292FDFE8|nr:hypothetical protein [Pedobacter aquatilis]